MITAVYDASVLIDVADTTLASAVARLPFSHITTDVVWNEIDGDQRLALSPLTLDLVTLPPGQTTTARNLQTNHRGLSFPDCTVFVIAQARNAILVTGDGNLRRAASGDGVEVHGTLWLLQQCHSQGLLSDAEACDKLNQCVGTNHRLPKAEVQKLQSLWCAEADA